MKKLVCLLVLAIFSLCAFSQSSKAQEKSKDGFERTLKVELEKSKYTLLEPIPAQFKLKIPSTDATPKIVRGISIRINFKGQTREFTGLTSNISMGEPQPLPGRNIAGQNTNNELKYYDYAEEEIIERAAEFFPEPGNYKIQFFLYGFKGIASNAIDIIIEEPTGINREALNFLNKYENPLSFQWIFTEKDGIAQLENFVNKYAESVYGEYAIYQLGLTYFNRGKFDKAKIEFEKLRNSKNKIIAGYAENSLRDTEENIKTRERTELTKNN
ncbi:MAG TPA: hypothetical protein VF721_17395 [Pyrinomonadaceae bacterium]|jgi:hypothetical protein